MVTVIQSSTLLGVDARRIEVEVELAPGLPFFSIIGLGDTAVQEAKYRIQAALRTTGIDLPHKRITINLAPASVRKDGASLDLPMALGLLAATEIISEARLGSCMALGELSLAGDLRPVRGVLPTAVLTRNLQLEELLIPHENGPEARAISGIKVVAARSLAELIHFLKGSGPFTTPHTAVGEARAYGPDETNEGNEGNEGKEGKEKGIQNRGQSRDADRERHRNGPCDLRDIRGQLLAKRALEIAAAGAHNLLFIGNPGAGKTMLARRLPTILPALSEEEQIEVTKIWSAAGLTVGALGLLTARPFRSPHHSISEAGLIGGGSKIRPGEVTLAHRGVLFLDEMPELPRRVLESLRQPIEDQQVVISRARECVTFPASFMLVGAANPCPCGWFGHSSGRCVCTSEEIQKYGGRISGALLDRIDMVVTTPSLTPDELLATTEGECSADVERRVATARSLARDRSGCPNARLSGAALRSLVRLEGNAFRLLKHAIERLDLSARSFERILRVARTIADLADSRVVSETAVAEALQYREPAVWTTKGPGRGRFAVNARQTHSQADDI